MLYERSALSQVWEVEHNLNTLNPLVVCWVETDGSYTKILPLCVEIKDKNTVVITFSRPYTGRVEIRNEKRWSDD